MPLTIVETDSFPTTIQGPAGGEPASAPSLMSQYLQPAANRLRYLYNRINRFAIGGSFTPSDDLLINTPTGKQLSFNGLRMESAADDGLVRVLGNDGFEVSNGPLSVVADASIGGTATIGAGATINGAVQVTGNQNISGSLVAGGIGQFAKVRAGRPWVIGNGAAGVHLVTPALNPLVFFGFFGVPSAGCILKIDGSGAMPNETLVVVTLDAANPVLIQDPAGGTIISIQKLDKSIHRVEICYLSGVWTLVDATYASV